MRILQIFHFHKLLSLISRLYSNCFLLYTSSEFISAELIFARTRITFIFMHWHADDWRTDNADTALKSKTIALLANDFRMTTTNSFQVLSLPLTRISRAILSARCLDRESAYTLHFFWPGFWSKEQSVLLIWSRRNAGSIRDPQHR